MTFSDTTIRSASEAEMVTIREILSSEGLPVEGVEPGAGSYFVVEGDGGVVGAIGVEWYGRFGLLRSAAVRPGVRGRGIGGELTSFAAHWARARGVSRLYLLTTTAQPFFARHGFRVVSRSTVPAEIRASSEFSALCPTTATVMMREL